MCWFCRIIHAFILIFRDGDAPISIFRNIYAQITFEPHHEKTNILVSDLVRQKPGCTAIEDGQRLGISDLRSRGIVLSM